MNVLLVDDDPTILECIGDQLRLAGYHPYFAADLHSAMRMIRSHPFDCVIADGLLPVGDPQEEPVTSWGILLVIFAKLRGIPGFLLTGYDHVMEEALKAGIPVKMKPIGGKEVLEEIALLTRTGDDR